jgi:hypothetical protein
MKKSLVPIVLVISTALISIAATVLFLQREREELLAQQALVNMAMFVKVARTLQPDSSFPKVKDYLDTAIDGDLRWLVEYEDAYKQNSVFMHSRDEILSVLRKYWSESPPFTGDKWAALRSDKAWVDDRQRKTEFLDKVK